MQLHLSPRSREDQRVWLIGNRSSEAGAGSLLLATRPDDHRCFASLRAMISQLRPLVGADLAARFGALDGYLIETGQVEGPDGVAAHWRLMADNITHAIMRRISRESVYTALVIDKAAKLLNEAVDVLGFRTVVVPGIDRLDRLTLKVLVRAVLILSPENRGGWQWRSASDPRATIAAGEIGNFVESRSAFLAQAASIAGARVRHDGAPTPLVEPVQPGCRDQTEISVALVLQNYDACLLWLRPALDDPHERTEAFRLLGLTLVNLNSPMKACDAWLSSSGFGGDPVGSAHLHYLRGLVHSKRSYDAAAGDAEFMAGMALLEGAPPSASGERDLERAWLLNGLALNDALRWRREQSRRHFVSAFSRLQAAFGLASGGESSAHKYLRFNLIANMAFLLEMAGEYAKAMNIFDTVFRNGDADVSIGGNRMLGTLAYRVGVLKWKAGVCDEAEALLQQAAEAEHAFGLWAMRDHVLRAQGAMHLAAGRAKLAAGVHEEGIALCRAERCAIGLREHAAGMVQAHLARSDMVAARQLCAELEEDEGLRLSPGADDPHAALALIRPQPLASKLPAYIPEVDLEGIPRIDINRFLASPSPAPSAVAAAAA